MPAFLPIILASTHLVLAADRVPQFNVEPSCRAVQDASTGLKGDEAGCKRSERAAQAELRQKWSQYSDAEHTHCSRLATLGGYPSYVELLTCLEIDKAANNLAAKNTSLNNASNNETTGQASVEGKAGRPVNQ